MPATCTFLIHQFSLLLLVGLPLFVGSFPLASVSIPSPAAAASSSSTDRSQFTATEPRGSSVSTREEPSFAAVSLPLLPREKESPQPSAAASISAWDPATDGQHTSSSGNAAIMSSQVVVESSSTETRTSGSSQTYSTDVFNTLGKGRTFRTTASSNSMSTGATGSSTWYTGMTTSGILAQHPSSVMRTEIADASSSTVDTAELETVTSRIYSPKSPISSLSEKYHPATGTSQHIDRSWDAESRTSGLRTNSRGSLATVYRSAERTSQVLTDSITLTDSTRKDLISQKEFPTSADQTQFPNPDQTQFPPHATHSGGRNSTSNATQLPNSSSRTVFTPSHLAPKTTIEDHGQPQSSSNTEGRIASSRTDSLSLSELSDRAQGRTLQTLREISVAQIFTTSGNEISSSADLSESSSVLAPWPYRQMALSAGHPEVTEAFTEALVTYFQAPSETRAVEGSHQMHSSSNTETALSSSRWDKVSVSDVADKDDDRILQTLRDSSSSHNATEMSTMANTKAPSSTDISGSSYTWTVVQNTKMGVPPEDAKEAVTHSQAVSRTTDREESDQLQSGSNTRRSISPAHTESVSISDPSDRDGEATRQTLRDISGSSTAAQIFTASSNGIPSSSGLADPSGVWTPGQNRQIDLSADVPDFTLSEASSEATVIDDGGQPWSSSNTENSIPSSHTGSASVSGLHDRGHERTLRTLRDVSNSYNVTQIFTTSGNEMSSSEGLTDSSYVQTPGQVRQRDSLSRDLDFAATPVILSQAPLEITEHSTQKRSSLNTESTLSSSHTGSASVPGLSDRDEEITLQTLRGISSFHNTTQMSTITNTKVHSATEFADSSSMWTAVHTRQMNLPPKSTDFTDTEVTYSQDHSQITENGDQTRSSSNTEQMLSRSHIGSASVSSLPDRDEEIMPETVSSISISLNTTQMSTMTNFKTHQTTDFADSSSAWTAAQTRQITLAPEDTDFTERAVTYSQAPSQITAVEDSGQIRSSSNTEKTLSTSYADSKTVSGLSDRDEESTLQTLRDVNISHYATEISTMTNSKTHSSTDYVGSSYAWTAGLTKQMNLTPKDHDFTETTIIQASSETADVRSSQDTFSNRNIEKRASQTESAFSTVRLTRDGEGTPAPVTNMSKSTDATEPMLDLENTSSSVFGSSATAQSRKESFPFTEMDFTESIKEPLLTYSSKASIYSSSTIDISSTGSGFETMKGTVAERRVSSASTDGAFLSSTLAHTGERTPRSLPDKSTSPEAMDSSTYNTEASRSSNSTFTSVAGGETEKQKDSGRESLFTEPSLEHSLEHSSAVPTYSSPKDSSTIRGSLHSVSSSRTSQSYTVSPYSSALFSKEEKQTAQSIINTTFDEVTESTSLYMEKSSSSELNLSSPEVYSRRTELSAKELGTSGPSTETFQSLNSSRIPTYSSFQSESSDTGMDYQPMSSTDTGKRTSDSHTDSTYISTTITRGGERTLLSITNHSTSSDSSESSTSYAKMSSHSESLQSSSYVTESRGSNMSSSNMDFSAPSTEPLAVHSLKTPGYSSTVREPRTTQFYSEPASNTLSFSSSPPMSPKQDVLPTTQPPMLFLSSEPSHPSSSSAFPSMVSSPPQTALTTFSSRLPSAALPTLPPLLSLLPLLSPTLPLLQPSESPGTNVPLAVSGGTTGMVPSTAESPHSKYNQSRSYTGKDSTAVKSTGLSPLLTETTEQLTSFSSTVTTSLLETEVSEKQNISFPGTTIEKNVPILDTFPTYLPKSTTVSETVKAIIPTLPSTTTEKNLVAATAGKHTPKITHTTLGLSTLAPNSDFFVTTKPNQVRLSSPTKIAHTTGVPTKGIEKSSATTVKDTEHIITTTHPPQKFFSSKTTAGPSSASSVPIKPTTIAQLRSPKTFPTSHAKASGCTTDTCHNNGKCITDGKTDKFQCQCSLGWQGEDCSTDVDECMSNPCPSLATCTNTEGSFQCLCALGYQMEKGQCNLVRTFVGQFPLTFNTTGRYSELHQVEEDIINMLNDSLAALPGYYTSTVKASRQSGTIEVSVLSTFSLVSNVNLSEIVSTLRSHIQACKAPTETCQFFSNLTLFHRGGLCKRKDPECDKETSVCVDLDGIAVCQCKPGYFKYNKLDHSCRACEDGYRLENDTCVSCPFGLGGFNCGNPYQLITIVIAAAGGGLLLIMGIALIVTCCQKNKNDISKLIFKSGDFQMSPYAEYPKNPRGQDWGRETIEMQENGSTKNLLQMTDVYYMPANLRNPELERNGLYPPYTGLPGSRHSCIYPGQYNPSFISDDSRRRDYF